MSIIAYFLHVDDSQLSIVKERPAIVWQISADPRFRSAALVDVDKDWQVLSWLASPKKREEQSDYVARMNAIQVAGPTSDKASFESALRAERAKLGVGEPGSLPTDDALAAIEGRGTEQQREPRLNFGLGGARVFTPAEVTRLAASLAAISESNLRASFNRQAMAKFDVGGMDWLGEDDLVFSKFLLPSFRKLQNFYKDAASKGHYVLVIYQ